MADPRHDRPSRPRGRRNLSAELKKAARLYGRGLSAKNAMIKVGSDSPILDARESLANPTFLREALEEARHTRVRFATLDRLARYKIVKHLADEATPAVVDAQLARLVFDVVRKGGDKSLAEAIVDEDAAMSDLERAQRMLDETLTVDAAYEEVTDTQSEQAGDARGQAAEAGRGDSDGGEAARGETGGTPEEAEVDSEDSADPDSYFVSRKYPADPDAEPETETPPPDEDGGESA